LLEDPALGLHGRVAVINRRADHFRQPYDCFYVTIFEFALTPQFKKPGDFSISKDGNRKCEKNLCGAGLRANRRSLFDALVNWFLADVNGCAGLGGGTSTGRAVNEFTVFLECNSHAARSSEEATALNQQM
jgi:hypothetical protein